MVFTVLAAVDLAGKKNYELTFPTIPTVTELRDRIDEVLSAEAAIRRPPQAGPFHVHRAQVFDERMEMWVDLVASSQLEDYCQVYIFQKETAWHKDTPGRIPPPQRPVGVGSPQYRRSASPPHYESYSAPLYADLRDSSSPYRGAGAGSPYGSVASPSRFDFQSQSGDDTATHSDKVRMVYEELDSKDSRSVRLDDWLEVFSKLRISGSSEGLTDATVEDLFTKKADRNEDGLLSFPEFQHFAEMYPKLLDSMYFRSRKLHHETLRKDKIKAQHELTDDYERRLDDARQAVLDAESGTLDMQQKADEADGKCQDTKDEEQKALGAKNDAHADSERSRAALRDAKTAEATTKEANRKKEAAKRAAQRSAEAAEKKHQMQVNEKEKLLKELEALQKKVAEKEKEIKRQEEIIDRASDEVKTTRGKAEDAEDADAERELDMSAKEVQRCEGDLRECINAENDRAADHRTAQRNTAQSNQQKQQLEKDLATARMKDGQRKTAEQRAEKQLDDHRKALEGMESREAETDARRAEEQRKENDLLQMEVRLREQREAVERKEEHLRRYSFF